MRRSTATTFLIATLLLATGMAQGKSRTFGDDNLEELEKSVVRVVASKYLVDLDYPWQHKNVETNVHLGTFVGPGFLVSAAAVADTSHLVMNTLGGAESFPLDIVAMDREVNLALVRPRDQSLLRQFTPVELDERAKPGDFVKLLNVTRVRRPAIYRGRISKVDVAPVATSFYKATVFSLDLKASDFGRSEPVFSDDGMIALVTEKSADFIRATPAALIQHFLDDLASGSYRGFVDLEIVLNSVGSPSRRAALQAPPSGGLRVARIEEGSPAASLLQVDDFIMKIGTRDIDSLGRISSDVWGKVNYQVVVNQFSGGDPIPLLVSRQGKLLYLELNARSADSTRAPVAAYYRDGKIPHLIVGGVVLQELSKQYLEMWEGKWQENAPLLFLYFHTFKEMFGRSPGERVVAMTGILADKANHGYTEMAPKIVASVNDLPATSIEEVRRILEQRPLTKGGRNFLKLAFALQQGEIILSYDALPGANARIEKTYRIKSPASLFRM